MMPSFFDLQRYAKTGIASADMTAFDKMRALAAFGGGTVQTLTGIPPLSFKADGKPLISLLMKGNTRQTGTPSPDNIITPEMCGVRTGNLFDINKVLNNSTISVSGTTITKVSSAYNYDIFSGSSGASTKLTTSCMILEAGIYTLSFEKIEGSGSTFLVCVCPYTSKTMSPETQYFDVSSGRTFVLSEKSYFTLRIQTNGVASIKNLMLNTGSTPLPYEPYGWAEKITCAGQTTPVYLGQVSTVRKIKKVVFNGTESWKGSDSASSKYLETISIIGDSAKIEGITSVSTHYSGANNVRSGDPIPVNSCCFLIDPGNNRVLYLKGSDPITLADFKAYLAAQYANGTPVTIWFVLSAEQTGITNEPLAKIGDYADELHSDDARVSIPTAKGQNTLTVDTDLQPSEMSITGHIKAI